MHCIMVCFVTRDFRLVGIQRKNEEGKYRGGSKHSQNGLRIMLRSQWLAAAIDSILAMAWHKYQVGKRYQQIVWQSKGHVQK